MSMIQISKETIEKLSMLSAINQSIKIVANAKELRVMKETKDLFCKTPIAEDFSRTVCIYDVRQFVSILSVFENPWIDLSSPKHMIIQDKETDAKQKLKYIDSAESIVNSSYFSKDVNLPEDIVVVDIEVPESSIKSIIDVTKKLDLSHIGFKGDGADIKFRAFSTLQGPNSETNSIEVKLSETTETFNLFYPAKSLELLKGTSKFIIGSNKVSIVKTGDTVFYITLDRDSEC